MFSGAAVVMGVASCGKTSVGEMLARELGVAFVEGDKLHPKSNIGKMSAGMALTDDDRWPWLTEVGRSLCGETGKIASCSALKKSYRQHITRSAHRPVAFIFLDGQRALLEQRISERKDHFMPASLLESQLTTLERPGPGECFRRFDIAMSVRDIVQQARAWLLQQDQT